MNYPLHTVCAWIGNTKAIAAGHYLQVTDADWARAIGGTRSGALTTESVAQNAAQQHGALCGTQSRNRTEIPANSGFTRDVAGECDIPHKILMGRAGLEHPPESSGKSHISETRGSKSGNIGPGADPSTVPDDPDLLTVVEAWPTLPQATRAAILAVLNAAGGGTR